jgi:putative spermidine/putrescine transport system permease protein
VLLVPALVILGGVFGGGLVLGVAQSVGLFSLVDVHGPTLRFYADVLRNDDTARALALTCYVACTATAISLVLGVVFALLLRSAFRGAGLLRLVVQLPLPVPHLVAAVGVSLLLAQSGLLARVLYAVGVIDQPAAMPALIYDRGAVGIITAYVWKETPFMALAALAALRSANSDLEQAARTLGARRWQTLRYVTLPLIAPGLLGAAVIVWAFTFGAFEVPLLLGQSYPRMLAAEAWQQYGEPNLATRPAAFALNMCVAGCAALALLPYLWLRRRADLHALGGSDPAQSHPPAPRPWWAALVGAVIVGWTVLPLVPLPAWSLSVGWRWPALVPPAWSLRTWSYLLDPATRALPALWTSMLLALVVTVLAVVFGLPAALALGRYRFRGRVLVEALVFAPLLVPPLSVAMGLQVVFIRLGLADTFGGVVVAHLLFALPYVVVLLANATPIRDQEREAQARSLGAGAWQALWYVTLPLLRPSLAAAALLAFLVSWSQYGLTLVIGGGQVWTLPLLLVAQSRGSDGALLAATALLVILPTFVFLLLAARALGERDTARHTMDDVALVVR